MLSRNQLSGLQDPEALALQQIVNGDRFADTPEMRRHDAAVEEAVVADAERESAIRRATDPAALLDAYNVQNMLEPSTKTRQALRSARTYAYAKDILAHPDDYLDGDAAAALDALSLGFSRDVTEWKRLKGMTDDPRQNLQTYLAMLDSLTQPASLATNPDAPAPSGATPFDRYYEATRSDEPRRWEALNASSLDDRYDYAIANSPETSRRFTDAAKDWVHSTFFDEDRIKPEEEAAWVDSEGGYGSDAMRRYFANREARSGKSAKELVRDREMRQSAARVAPSVNGLSARPDASALSDATAYDIPSWNTKINLRIDPKTGKTSADDLHIENLTLDEYAETEKRRDLFIAKRRAVAAYQERMDEQVRQDRAHAMLPFLNDNESAAALSALRGEDMSKYRGFFTNGFGNDTERRDAVISVCAALRPKNQHGAWEDWFGRAVEGATRAAHDLPQIAELNWKGRFADTPEERAELERLKKEVKFDVGYRRALEAWIPNDDDNFAEQAMKGLADSGFLQALSVGGAVAHTSGTALLAAPHPAAKIGGTALNLVGLAADAVGSASMIADSYENLMLNGVDPHKAAALSVPAGIINWYVEKGPVDILLGKGLSPAELKRLGWRALFKTIAKHDPQLIAAALKTDAKQISRSLIAECGEEFIQAANDEGFVRLAKGEDHDIIDAWLSKDSVRAGVDSFIDAIPTCTGFGLMSVHHPFSSKNGQAVDAYQTLADETVRRYALKNNLDTANKEDMAKAKRLILENAARHARATQGMDDAQRRAYFANAVGEEGMSPSEASFYTEASNLYSTLAQMEGQQFADAAVHGEITEAVLDRAGIQLGHDEAGNINSVTVDGHTRAVVTEQGTTEVTDAHTGETGKYRGLYNPEDDSIHVTVPTSVEDVGDTARTTTIPHELLHATLEALSNDPALPAETRATLDALLKTETPGPTGEKLDANEAAAQFVERVFAVANKNFTPDREVVALGNIVRNVGIALKKAVGSKTEFLPAIVTRKGDGGISITDLLDPSFLADLDQLQISAAAEGTADPVVGWYASVMQPFFKSVVDATTRAKTAENLEAAKKTAIAERGETIAPPRTGTKRTVFTPGYEMSVEADAEWVPLESLVESTDDREVQMRDRSRVATDEQVLSKTRKGVFQPLALFPGTKSDDGAPIVGADNRIISGHGRKRMLDQLVKEGRFGEYLDAMNTEAQWQGLPAAPEDMKNPVLILKVKNGLDKREDLTRFAELSNRWGGLERSAAEHAESDSRKLSDEVLRLYNPDASGNLLAASNRPFMASFLKEVGATGLTNADGTPTAEAALRVKRAMMTAIFGNDDTTRAILRDLLERNHELSLSTLNNALLKSAGKLLALKRKHGSYDIVPDVREAAVQYIRWRGEQSKAGNEKLTLTDHLNQNDFFSEAVPPLQQSLAHLLETGRFGATLDKYTELVSDQEIDEQTVLGGIIEKRTPLQLLGYAERAVLPEGETAVTPDPASPRYSIVSRHDALMASDPDYRAVYDRFHRPDGSALPNWLKAPNGQPSKLDPVQYVQVRTPAFKAWFGDWEKKAEIDKAVDFALNGDPVATLTGDEFAQTGNHDLVDRVAAYYASLGGSVEHPELGTVIIDREGVKSSLGHGIGRAKAAAFAAVPDVIRKGLVFDRQANWKGRGVNSCVLCAPIRIGGDTYVCEAIVEQKTQGKERRFYLHEVNLQSSLADTIKTPTGGASIGKPSRPVRSIIAQRAAAAQGVSKVVDENGEPLVVYHGSKWNPLEEPSGNAVFRQGTRSDIGIHFGSKDQADSVNETKEFGSGKRVTTNAYFIRAANVRRIEDKGENGPLNLRFLHGIGLSEDAANRIDADVHNPEIIGKRFSDLIRRDYGIDSSEYRNKGELLSAINSVREDRGQTFVDFDTLNSYRSEAINSILTDELSKEGIDGFVYRNEYEGEGDSYVVFSPAQIKSATDNTGAFSPANPDIRFALSRPVERREDLIAVHNLSLDSIKSIAEMGGFAMPSIAVVKDSYGHNEFGDVTVMFGKDTIDPRKNRRNALYSHDAWTPTFPPVFNKIDEKGIEKTNQRILESLPRSLLSVIGNEGYHLNYLDGIHEAFNQVSDPAEAYASNVLMKAAYLVSKGERVDPVMVRKDYFSGKHGVVKLLTEESIADVIEIYGDELAAATDGNGAMAWKIYERLVPEIKKLIRSDNKTVNKILETTGDSSFSTYDVSNIADVIAAIKFDKSRGKYGTEVADEWKTKGSIRDRVDANDPAYRAWINTQYSNPILGKGVYNGKERHTASGNLRSWDALHDPATLENIVKAMAKTQIANGSGILGRNPFGVAVKKFGSINDLVANEDMLEELTREQEKSIKEELTNRLSALVAEYMQSHDRPDDNKFLEYERSADMMFDAWEQGRGSLSAMKKLLNEWGYSASDDLVRRIKSIFDDISVMPTNYFEAKPQRAVRFDEMKAWVVPDDISADQRKMLDDRNQLVYTYKKGDESDRLAKVNEAADFTNVRFSLVTIGNRKVAVNESEPLTTAEAQNETKVRTVLSSVIGREFSMPGELQKVKVDKIFADEFWRSNYSEQIRNTREKLWRAKVSAVPILGEIVTNTTIGPAEAARHINRNFKKKATFYRCKTEFGLKRWNGVAVYPCDILVLETGGNRYVYDIVGISKPALTAAADLSQADRDRLFGGGTRAGEPATPHSIPNSASAAQPRFSLSADELGDPFANSSKQPVDFLLAHRIFAANGKPPTREETLKLLKAYGSNEAPRDVLARAISLSQDINTYLEKIGQNPVVVRAVAAAGLALEAKGAQTRARNALMKFDAKAADAKQKIDKAYRRQVDNATGIAYHEMLSYYGLDFNEILKAMEPPARAASRTSEPSAEADTPSYELSDADRAAVDAAVKAIVTRGEGLAAAANAEHPGKPEKKPSSSEALQAEGDTDPAILRAQAMNAAVVEAVRKSGITVDNPLAMVALIRRLTEDYIRRNPNTVPDFNEANVFSSRVALAQFAANLSQFAQAVAQGYSPSHARIRIARLCERLDERGLVTVNQVERVGQMIFADLNTDIIRQSRADLMHNLHKGDKAKKGEEADPNRWRGLDYYAKKHGVNLAEPDRVVSAFGGNYIRILRRVIELSVAKAAERAAQLQDTVDAFNDTEDKEKYRDYQNALLELDILSAYGALRTKMPAEIADKAAAIKRFVQNDLDALNAKKEAFEQKRVALRDTMTAAIVGNPKDNGRMPDKAPGFLYSLVGMLETRARILTSFCADASKRRSALAAFDQLQRTIFHCSTRERAFLNDAKDEMRDTIKRIFGRFRGKSRLESLLATPVDPKTCNLLDRGGQHTKWKIGNVMQMYVSCVQSDYADNCAAHGRDAAYVQLLKDTIAAADPRLLDLIEAMRNLYADYGKRISAATLSASGVPIQTPNPLYMPVKPLLLMRGKSGEGRAFHPYAPALTPRVKHGYDFDQSADIMEMWYDRIQQSAHTVGYLELSPLIQGTLQSSHVLEAIHQAWGKDAANKWNDYVFTMLSGRRHDDANMVSATTKASSIVFLWGNIRSNLNQLQAIFTAALSHDMGGIRGLGKNLSFWALKPVDMWQAARDLTATQAFKARYGSDLNMAVANAQRQSKYGIMRKVKSVNNVISFMRDAFDATISVGMKGIKIGDKVGVLTLANVYRSERIALENAGMSPDEASEQAAEKLMLIAENTAQGTTDMNTSDFQNAHGALTRMFLQFKTATLQQLSYEYEAFEDWKHDPTDPKKAVRLFSVLFVNHVLASIVPTAIDALMNAIFGAIRGDDDKDKEENRRRVIARALARVVTGPLGAILIFGSLVDNGTQMLADAFVSGKFKKPFGNKGGSLPADSALAMLYNSISGFTTEIPKLVEAANEGTTKDVLREIGNMALELFSSTAPGRMIKKSMPQERKSHTKQWY